MTGILKNLVAKANKKIKSNNNLFDLCFTEKDWGVGNKYTRGTWRHWGETCYWTLTRVIIYHQFPRGKRGKAWGVLTWRGVTDGKETQVRSGLKREWKKITNEVPPPIVIPTAQSKSRKSKDKGSEDKGNETPPITQNEINNSAN
eukprot:TRINITY_DN1678_c0_g1_i2.p1 TRINITY_DN1678_c0_g1~~TRINITY_DN1678_c0_g1_i2.p1  ORF type:complete len:145 (-),score=31.91 TRINITY_DN1678_c0_g1_i2:22-456(-)